MNLSLLFLAGIFSLSFYLIFFFNDTATTEIYTLSLHDALPISTPRPRRAPRPMPSWPPRASPRSEEHTSELQSLAYLVCRLLLEKKKKTQDNVITKNKIKKTIEEKTRQRTR